MNWIEHIESTPDVLFGKPRIKGTRISVDLLLEKLSVGETVDQILVSYPNINKNSILAALAYAAETIKSQKVISFAS